MIKEGWVLVFSWRSFRIVDDPADDEEDNEEVRVVVFGTVEEDDEGVLGGNEEVDRGETRTEEGTSETEYSVFLVFLSAKLRKISSIRKPEELGKEAEFFERPFPVEKE